MPARSPRARRRQSSSRDPRHPYTRALLDCELSTRDETEQRLLAIPGEVPDLVVGAAGLHLRRALRCERVPVCRELDPGLRIAAPRARGGLRACGRANDNVARRDREAERRLRGSAEGGRRRLPHRGERRDGRACRRERIGKDDDRQDARRALPADRRRRALRRPRSRDLLRAATGCGSAARRRSSSRTRCRRCRRA